MAEDKTKPDNRDRSSVADDENYELESFARQAGITIEEARDLIREHGNDRVRLLEAVAKYRRRAEESGGDQATRQARSQSSRMNLGDTRSRNG